jgi:serine/threonine protein kinase
MGRVFRASDERLKRDVALKVIRPEMSNDEVLRKRFLREARAMAALNHPHVVTVYHVDESGPVPFFVMPLLRGETLEARRRRERQLPVADVLRIGRQAAEGLAHAHECGRLIHRDVKPLNLWLEPASPLSPGGRGAGGEGEFQVKILDFGLVRRLDRESIDLTAPDAVLGALGFMAPEQLAGGEVDHRCDQYALACVLYLLCTGKAVAGRFRDPHELNPAVPREFSDGLVRMLSQEPGDRFPAMREVVDLLARLERC